ncbi:C-X-C motif chemokine 10 [Onychostoma macrolepis]|uniref:C-X-C motif chemokine 10 n=1 Tax=Onychostoma macrolepis TaxID=369639 RepID=UPI00272B5317|nr:C-X-C motif chemokine 10 [Onychostoma macrolepis]
MTVGQSSSGQITEAREISPIIGQRMFISKRCLCSRTYDNLRPGNIKECKVYKPSAFCNTTEIIVILKKSHIKVCLNPNSKLGRQLQENCDS